MIDGLLGELTQEKNQTELVGYGFPPLNDSDPTLPKCGEWPECNRKGEVHEQLGLSWHES